PPSSLKLNGIWNSRSWYRNLVSRTRHSSRWCSAVSAARRTTASHRQGTRRVSSSSLREKTAEKRKVMTTRTATSTCRRPRRGRDNRSDATTVLAVSALIDLQSHRSLSPEARKLLSFTDNRQDASLQAGHFHDCTQGALLRSARHKASQTKGAAGLSHADLSR